MATDGTVLRFRTPSFGITILLATMFGVSILSRLAGSAVATPTGPGKPAIDPSTYRSYHFVLLVKSDGPNITNATSVSNVSEELVILPADADLLERSNGGAIELKPQPLPGHITSAFVKKYRPNRIPSKRSNQTSPTAKRPETVHPIKSTEEPSILLHVAAHGNGKKQRYPKKAAAGAGTVATKRPTEKAAIRRLDSKLVPDPRQLPDGPDIDLGPFELVATSKGQPRTVRKTGQLPTGGKLPHPRYEVIGTFRDAHVSRTRTRQQSATGPNGTVATGAN